jgi:hypothetical protein
MKTIDEKRNGTTLYQVLLQQNSHHCAADTMKHLLITFLNYLMHSSSQMTGQETNGTTQKTLWLKKHTLM